MFHKNIFVFCCLNRTPKCLSRSERQLGVPNIFFAQMRMEKDRLVIYLDVKHFSPDDLSVSVSDEFITVHAQHEDRQVRKSCRDLQKLQAATLLTR